MSKTFIPSFTLHGSKLNTVLQYYSAGNVFLLQQEVFKIFEQVLGVQNTMIQANTNTNVDIGF